MASSASDCSESSASDRSHSESTASEPSFSECRSVSILQRLRSPTASVLARKRVIKTNPPVGSKRGKGRCNADPKNVSVTDRLKAYSEETFVSSSGQLFCSSCREVVALKKSVIEMHIASQKHKNGKERRKKEQLKEQCISEALKAYDNSIHPVGESLPDTVRVRQVKVVQVFLKAGIPLAKVDCLRELLEENSSTLTSSSNLRQLIPFILHEEVAKIKREIEGRPVSIIFDGTTHVCEAMVIVLRFIDDDWCIQQRVCRLMLLEKSLTGEEVARQIISTISTELGIPSSSVIAAARDRASVNDVAMRTVGVVYGGILDIGCFSHTLDHVGERIITPHLDAFFKAWISLFSHSPKARLLWRMQTGLPSPSYSTTRWWSKYEVLQQLHDAFGDAVTFLSNEELPKVTVTKMTNILNNPATSHVLKVELAVTVDAMKIFVQTTYNLEGDGPLALVAYMSIRSLYAHVTSSHFPNVTALTKQLARGNSSLEQQLNAYARGCIDPAYAYFHAKFDNDLKPAMQVFKAARYFCPATTSELKPVASDLDILQSLSFLTSADITNLKNELPLYLAAVEDLCQSVDPTKWWEMHLEQLPHWANAYKNVILVQPSSAAAERVFSLLTNSFGQQQTSSLEDYISVSVMLQYNKR